MLRINLILVAAWTLFAQDSSHRNYSLSATLPSGIEFKYKVFSIPSGSDHPRLIDVSGVEVGDPENVAHRFVVDETHHQYFGYDISAEPADTPSQYRVTISPLTLNPEKLPEQFRHASRGPLTPIFLAKYPDPQIVSDGDTIELDLLVSPDGQQKIVDNILVTKPEPVAATSAQEPKDFTPDDAPIDIDFENATVWINGQKYSGHTSFDRMPGATVTFYFPGRGRYILSLVPHEGFSKMGAVRDNVFLFEADGQQYEVRTMNLILGSKGSWNLYVLHDPSYVPDFAAGSVHVETNRLENLVAKRYSVQVPCSSQRDSAGHGGSGSVIARAERSVGHLQALHAAKPIDLFFERKLRQQLFDAPVNPIAGERRLRAAWKRLRRARSQAGCIVRSL